MTASGIFIRHGALSFDGKGKFVEAPICNAYIYILYLLLTLWFLLLL